MKKRQKNERNYISEILDRDKSGEKPVDLIGEGISGVGGDGPGLVREQI